ncbi:MotA/TolQ/ExbB proton channel family protein [Pseudoalteromonas luteoviolacea]|uniref:MotA/TolQ/ExbB proton channel family protein n=1 Tax=Pseudoalteromonas luteoviolacea TaxID=43657 RepID=UPI001F173765|nr:MotA/TolQ/ExbB proton channel family protein [Pseudoalteromonas luteoviolacea]MCF6439355.1 MotA/TolQ/ExbB proton channel family protein [Pseudoalteromonas luteoviolacea]
MVDMTELLSNGVVLALLCVASAVYYLIFDLYWGLHRDNKRDDLKNCQGTLLALTASLPLLGLLGTITGLLDTFEFISIFDALNQQAVMSGGISSALITTKLGLVLAVPALIFRQLLLFKYHTQRAQP